MPIAHALAHMHARLGEFDLARSLAARCLEIAEESGQRTDAAVLTEVAADVETLAGNHEAAERVLSRGCDWFVAMGEPHAVLEALHALTQVACHAEVDTDGLAAMVPATHRGSRALLEAALAAAYRQVGRLVKAEHHAVGAVAFFATTDQITFHANSSLILGDVLRDAGRPREAEAAFRQALDLYRQKGSIVETRIAEARLG